MRRTFCSSPCKLPYYKKSDPASLLVFYAYATGGDSRSSTYIPSSCAKYKIAPFSLLRDGFSGLEVAFDMKCVPYSLSSATQTNTPIHIYRDRFFALCPVFLCATCMDPAIGLCRARKSLIVCRTFCSSPCKLPYYQKSDPTTASRPATNKNIPYICRPKIIDL